MFGLFNILFFLYWILLNLIYVVLRHYSEMTKSDVAFVVVRREYIEWKEDIISKDDKVDILFGILSEVEYGKRVRV